MPATKFQIMLSGQWKDYEDQEDQVLKRAFLVGHPKAKFELRGQRYEYHFDTMKQKNLGSGKERDIRPPYGMKPPSAPIIPPGPMVVINVPQNYGGQGGMMEVNDPGNPGQKMQVQVPPNAKKGQKMAVPVKKGGHGAAAKAGMAVGGAAVVGGMAVGGAILGDHLAGGGLGADGVLNAIGDQAGNAADAIAPHAEVAGNAIAGAAEDVGNWLGNAAEDAGDFIMDLF